MSYSWVEILYRSLVMKVTKFDLQTAYSGNSLVDFQLCSVWLSYSEVIRMAQEDVEDLEQSGQKKNHQGDRTGVPPSSQAGTTPPRMEDHCIQPSTRMEHDDYSEVALCNSYPSGVIKYQFHLPFMFQGSDISVFEVNIRFVGGLLAAYALTGDAVSTPCMLNRICVFPHVLLSIGLLRNCQSGL